MKFSEASSTTTYRITGYDESSISVNQGKLTRSFIITPDKLITTWEPQHITTMTPADLEPLFADGAEVILIGSGTTQAFPPAMVWQALVQHGIGFEIMRTDAACRTYNVLSSEARRIVAAFFI